MSKTREQIFEALKKYFTSGFLHEAINIASTNIYKMISSFSFSFKREYNAEEYLKVELNPQTTNDLIANWEEQVGIPDECFSINNLSIEQRRNQVLTKLTAQVQTAEDFIDLAATLGVTVTVTPKLTGGLTFPYTFPFTFATLEDFFVIVVDIDGWNPTAGFAYTFPFTFGEDQYVSQIQCLFDKLKPANCDIEYI